MFWRIHDKLFNTVEQYNEICEWIESQGDRIERVSGPFPKPPEYQDDISMAFTTLQDALKLFRQYSSVVTLFFDNFRYNTVNYYGIFEKNNIPILNNDAVWMPIEYIKKRYNGKWFIKSDTGLKTLTGDIFDLNDPNCLIHQKDLSGLFLIATPKVIDEIEYRFWIVNKEIVAQSAYSWNDKNLQSIIPEKAIELANKVATAQYQVDDAYVVDIVKHNNIYVVNEINALSTSGFYNADIKQLFSKVKEYLTLVNEELDDQRI